MLRCGFGLKDAPRLWNKLLRQVLEELGLAPTQSDPQLLVWHVSTPGGVSSQAPRAAMGQKRLVLILSSHVNDFKGSGEAEYRRRLIAGFEKEFSALKIKEGTLECVGVMRGQNT